MNKKIGRNEPCWCGSGKKYKQCHMQSDQAGSGQKSYSPPGKRKFKAKVLSLSGKSHSVFKQVANKDDAKRQLKFETTQTDYRVKPKKGDKPLFSKQEEAEPKPTRAEQPQTPGAEFKPTTKDWQKKQE